MACGIYLIKNKFNNKVYIGQSINIKARWNAEKWHGETGNHEAQAITRAIHKYGKDNFEFRILEELIQDRNILDAREKYWIAFYDSCNPVKGYNVTKGGQNGHLGLQRSPETKQRISKALSGKKRPSMQGKPSGMTGKKQPVSAIKAFSEKLKGHPYWGPKVKTAEMRQKQSNAWTPEMRKSAANRSRNRPKIVGWYHSNETKKKMSEAKKGKPAVNLGIPRTEDQRKNDSIVKLRQQLSKGLPSLKHTFTDGKGQHCVNYFVSEWEMAKALTGGSAAVSVIREILANLNYQPKRKSIGWQILQGTTIEYCSQSELLDHRLELR